MDLLLMFSVIKPSTNAEQLSLLLQFGRRRAISGTLTLECPAMERWTILSYHFLRLLETELEIAKVKIYNIYFTPFCTSDRKSRTFNYKRIWYFPATFQGLSARVFNQLLKQKQHYCFQYLTLLFLKIITQFYRFV